jgi:quercetin dioxygenase-like cupin family protein
MKTARVEDNVATDAKGFVAQPFLEGDQSQVRLIRIAPGHVLPPHRHGKSDLMLYVVDGTGELETASGTRPFTARTLAFYPGDEELRVHNTGTVPMTLLAFLAPKANAG